MKNKYQIITLIVLILSIVGIIIYIYKTIDWDAPKDHQLAFVNVNNKKITMQNVHVMQIPQEIYDSVTINPQWSVHLFGNQKRVLFVTWDGCPYLKAFRQALDTAFNKSSVFHRYYTRAIQFRPQTLVVTCRDAQGKPTKDCAMWWLSEHCSNNICIINPLTKEMVVDESHNPKQLLPLLMAYSTWNEPLLKRRKIK